MLREKKDNPNCVEKIRVQFQPSREDIEVAVVPFHLVTVAESSAAGSAGLHSREGWGRDVVLTSD